MSLPLNAGENLKRGIQRFDPYLTASGKIKVDGKVHVIGEIYNTLKFATGEDRNKISVLKKV